VALPTTESRRRRSRGSGAVRKVASLAIVLAVALGAALVAPGPAAAKTRYRYDCNGRSGTYVAAAFRAAAPDGTSSAYTVVLECGVPGPLGWGINHILDPDYSYDGEPLRQHFAGYLTDWEAYGFAKALQTQPWIQDNGNQLYWTWIPIYDLHGNYLGEQEFNVVVDPSTYPAIIKTAWGNPEDIRTITGTYYKEDYFVPPPDFDQLVLNG
jgi:hypothetical protein